MSKTIEAIIGEDGKVRLLKAITLEKARRALVTILDEVPVDESTLELGYKQMAEDEEREAEASER